MNFLVNQNYVNGVNQNRTRQQSFGTCTNPPSMIDKMRYFVRTEPYKASLIGGSALLLTVLGVVKHKSIAKFVKKIFKK